MSKAGKKLIAVAKQANEGTYIQWTPPELGGDDLKPKYFVRGKQVTKKVYELYFRRGRKGAHRR